MAYLGKDSIVGVKPSTSAWGTAETLAASTGILPVSIDPVLLKAEIDFDDSSGLGDVSQYTKTLDVANPTIQLQARWNGHWWCFYFNWIGDDTQTGAGPYTHTGNLQQESALKHITMAAQLDPTQSDDIYEWPSLKPTEYRMEADGGFWNHTVTTLGDTILTSSNATNDATSLGNVTYVTKGQRMRYKANQLRMNSQSGGALGSSDVIADARNMAIALARPYDEMGDVLRGTSHLTRAEPIQSEKMNITLSFDQVTLDGDAHRDDLESGNEFKADVVMSETVSAVAHSFTQEFGYLVPVDPQVTLERGLRIPMTHNYMAIKPSSTPTGLSTSNIYHAILDNNDNITYETNT